MPKRVASMKDIEDLADSMEAMQVAIYRQAERSEKQAVETREVIANLTTRIEAVEKRVAGSDCEPAGLAIHDQQILEDFAGWLTRIYFVVSPSDSNRIDFNSASWSEVDKQPEELIRQYREYKG